jgi:antitoxin MazE
MRVRAKIQKWGNGLGLRVSGPIRDIPHFEENTTVELDIDEHGFTATKVETHASRRALPFNESDLLKGMTPEKAYADILIKPLSSEF